MEKSRLPPEARYRVVVDRLAEEVEADSQELTGDVAAFVRELIDGRIIERWT